MVVQGSRLLAGLQVAQVALRLVLGVLRLLLARRYEHLLAVQVQVLVGHEIVHGLVESLAGDAAALVLHLAHGRNFVELGEVVGVDLFGEPDVVPHGGLRVLLLLLDVVLVRRLLNFGGLVTRLSVLLAYVARYQVRVGVFHVRKPLGIQLESEALLVLLLDGAAADSLVGGSTLLHLI